jgi:carbon-monoxide dehydrogenase medium subunit
MREFHRGPYETAVGPGEMLTEVRIALRPSSGSAYEKVERRAGDWAVAAAGASVSCQNGIVAHAGVALTAVGADVTSADAEAALNGKPPSEEAFGEAARIAAEGTQPVTDQRGSAEYKRHVVQELTHRALRRATERALRGEA